MMSRGTDHLQALESALGTKADGTLPSLPTRWLTGNDERLDFGGVAFEFKHCQSAHTPGDTLVWLLQKSVLFSGDVVYVNRMLGVLPVSQTKHWLDIFAVIEQLNPRVLVPGHGNVTDVTTARVDTPAYLLALRAHMKKAVDDGVDVSAAVKSFNNEPFVRLLNAAELKPGNASRVYLEVERE